ncbi:MULTISPECIES: signal peptide peptidase SppA [Sphingobium]|uniref:Protease 4 n=1 Tax=Sphingobium fuliginis (strain ATCC 27551) TaxID=336203 RepID=A0ABQ1FBN0_SPHSA|nr:MULTISPECIES: signal peptide peptidase SppA [Sphingobium]AJR25728.1 serine protease [Sphingobium sp. YBL2]RYL96069.1 signal peptide peptidase SppA [Sphingobium fuliginis]UXC92372.1 signal peptide peptidase SppA [Sphingobium sp. RSMS]WDA37908.1 signal peptide peptidase SppA [Sphingobium sp. YC-XJ3]GGA05524.1 protease 4 [Sphingobium fuliginis]
MAFVKGVWRILVAIKDGLVLLFLLMFFGALYAALSWSPKPAQSVGSGALLLKLNGTIVEQPSEIDPMALLSGGSDRAKEYGLADIVAALDAARDDRKVKAVVLNLDGFMGGGQVALARVGKALDAVRAAKKPVFAYAAIYSDDSYQLAAHASESWVDPLGGVAITGRGGSGLYYKGLIDKLGVNTHVYRVGTYKSFVEPFTRTGQSPEAKQANQALADALWEDWRQEVAKARPRARLAAYVGNPAALAEAAGGNLAKAALGAGLVDRVGDEAAFGARVAEVAGDAPDDRAGNFAAIDLKNYMRAHKPANDGEIGVLTIAGDIVDGEAGPGTAAGDTISALLRKALADKDLKALVVRVDSPGGSVMASEKIRSAIMEAKSEGLPVVVSMGNVAASGGYWVSTPADVIFAEPDTITGSIGVFGIIPSFEGTLAKMGVTTDGVKTTPLSGQPDIAGGTTPEFDRIMQMGVEDIYGRFVGLVAQSRRKTPQQIDAIAQGRVWDGGTARQIGLVDRFGGLEEAIAEAARLAKIDPAKARPYRIAKEPDKFAEFVQSVMDREDEDDAGAPSAMVGRDLLGRQAIVQRNWALQAVADVRALVSGAGVRADCLECRGYGAPRVATAADDRGMVALLLGLWR